MLELLIPVSMTCLSRCHPARISLRSSRPPRPSATIRQCIFPGAHVQIFLGFRPRMCYSAPAGKNGRWLCVLTQLTPAAAN
jgi:hypothetical protein